MSPRSHARPDRGAAVGPRAPGARRPRPRRRPASPARCRASTPASGAGQAATGLAATRGADRRHAGRPGDRQPGARRGRPGRAAARLQRLAADRAVPPGDGRQRRRAVVRVLHLLGRARGGRPARRRRARASAASTTSTPGRSAPARRSRAGSGTPQPGDLIVWDEHIGIVEAVLPDGRDPDDRGQLVRRRSPAARTTRPAAARSATSGSAEPGLKSRSALPMTGSCRPPSVQWWPSSLSPCAKPASSTRSRTAWCRCRHRAGARRSSWPAARAPTRALLDQVALAADELGGELVREPRRRARRRQRRPARRARGRRRRAADRPGRRARRPGWLELLRRADRHPGPARGRRRRPRSSTPTACSPRRASTSPCSSASGCRGCASPPPTCRTRWPRARARSAAALQLIRHETLAAVGLYDEELTIEHANVDFCLRAFDRRARVRVRAGRRRPPARRAALPAEDRARRQPSACSTARRAPSGPSTARRTSLPGSR